MSNQNNQNDMGRSRQQQAPDRQNQNAQDGRQVDDNQDDLGRDINDASKSGNDSNDMDNQNSDTRKGGSGI